MVKSANLKLTIAKRSLGVTLFAIVLIWCFQQAGIWNNDIINLGGWTQVRQFLQASLHPDLSGEFLRLTGRASLTTLGFAVCGTALSVLLGSIGGILLSEVWWDSFRIRFPLSPRLVFRAILTVPRAIHEAIWGLFLVNIFGLDPLVGIIAIALPFGAIVAKVFSEILDETPRDPFWALLNAGVAPGKAFLYGLFPEAFPNLLSYTFYRFECSIRSAAILGIIGAGGLGYEIFLSFQSLRYEQMWTLFWALILLTGAIDFWSALLRRRLGAPDRLELKSFNRSRRVKMPGNRDPIGLLSALIAIVLLIVSFGTVGADFSKLWSPQTGDLFVNIVSQSIPPDFSGISERFRLASQTLAMSILAMSGAGFFAIVLGFIATSHLALLNRKSPDRASVLSARKIAAIATRLFLLVARAIPAPIWALVFLFVLFPGIVPGAIALGVYNLGILGRLMTEAIENLDDRPAQGLHALGATGAQVFLYAILPMTLPRFLAYILYRWEVCVRATVIVGLVGAGGLGRLLTEQSSSFDYSGMMTTLLFFMGLTFVVDTISTVARQSLR